MEYQIKYLAGMAGVTTRTLRFYEEEGLLLPDHINRSGYRVYASKQVDRLQQILFYKELGFSLEKIKSLILEDKLERVNELKQHHLMLLDKMKQLEILIANVEKTIALKEGKSSMSDEERFEGFKKKIIKENEEKYGNEVREKYGIESLEKSNRKIMDMSMEKLANVERMNRDLNSTLKAAFLSNDPAGALAQKACQLHKDWLLNYWSDYSKEAHLGLVQMYVDDERFTEYYDGIAPGCAVFLRDAMKIFLK
ncbi:MAG: MerR family transcriptional regulator [Eubacteriales bacterium]